MSSVTLTDTQQRIREQAAQRFEQLGWPTVQQEEWRYTNLAPLARKTWKRAVDVASTDTLGASHCGLAVAELVFVNGILVPDSCSGKPLFAGLQAGTLATANPEILEQYFARFADYQRHPLTALNTARAHDGAVIEVRGGVEGFVHLLFVGSDGFESHPRNLVIAHRGSQITIVETYVGSGSYFTNAVTEIIAEEGSVIDHCRVECESLGAYHIGTVQIHQERSSSVTSRSVALGGGVVRNETNVVLAGEGASSVLDGLFVISGEQHVDNHTVIEHAVPHCDSIELYKGILDQKARGIFEGLIVVRPNAQKSVSRQTNHNLLLSASAVIDSKPTLEIHNDDVKCNHGSTIGQLSEEAMFYLRSRGIDKAEAKSMLVYAFASEIIERMKVDTVKEFIGRKIFRQIPERVPERREA